MMNEFEQLKQNHGEIYELILNENEAKIDQWLGDMRQQASQKTANETDGQRNLRLEDKRQRRSHRFVNKICG